MAFCQKIKKIFFLNLKFFYLIFFINIFFIIYNSKVNIKLRNKKMDELFDVFDETEQVNSVNVYETLDEVKPIDKMANLEMNKKNKAREYSENLLKRLTTAGQKRSNDNDEIDEPLMKISALGRKIFF